MNWTSLSKQSALWKVQSRAGPSRSRGRGHNNDRLGFLTQEGWRPEPTFRRWRCPADEPMEDAMGRYVLLWLLGVPIPILLLIWAFGGLH